MNARLLYLVSLSAFGVVSIIDTALAVLAGPTLRDWVTGFVGLLVLLAAIGGFRSPEKSGAPTESRPLLWLVVAGSALYVLVTVATWP